MTSETIHASQRHDAARRVDHDAPDPGLIDAGAGEAEPGLRGFAMVPPYPTSSIRRLASGDRLGGSEAGPGVTGVLQRRKGAGRPLDRVDADRFGAGFGADLSGVRVHTDGEADSVARSVESVAFTYGRDVYFTRGSYAPGTDSGDRLLAHELAHVVQGSSGRWGAGGGPGVRIGRADDPAESAADAAADQVMAQMRRGDRPDPTVVGSLPAVQGEPVARTVRRAGIKSLAKKVKKAFTGKKKTHPRAHPSTSPTLGGASIAELKAASDAAHASRHRSSSSGPERKRRSSSRSSRSHHDESKKADHSGEGSESESEETFGYSTDLNLVRPGHGYSQPGDLRFDDSSESSESESEEKNGHGYSNPAMLEQLLGADSDSSSESSEDEGDEKGRYDTDLNLPGVHYSVPPPGGFDFDDGSSESSEDEDEDIFGSEEKAPGTHYSVPPPGGFDFDEGSSESSEDEDAEIFGDERKKYYTTNINFQPEAPRPAVSPEAGEGPESEGEEPAPERKKGHRAFLIRNLPGSFANETKSGRSGMEGPIGDILTRLTRGNAALALLEGGGTVAAAIGAVRHQVLKQQLQAVGEDTDKAITIVRAYVDDQREFLRRQDLPVDMAGKLGDISTRKVHYDSKAEQAKSLVTVKGGKLTRSGGEAVDTSKSSTFHTGNGAEIFVASDTGELHMASHQIGQYHHSSLLAGDRVSVGGEMKVTGGKIDWISNKSGHYAPTQEHLVQFVHWLGKDGVDLKSITIRDGFGFQGGMTADVFVAGVDEDGDEDTAMGFHALKLQVLIKLYEAEYGDEVDNFLEEQGWDVFDGEVLNARPGQANPSKEVISALKRRFGEPTGAKEKV